LPLWAVVAMVAGTVVLSVATTLITLAVERMRRSRRTPAAEPESRTSAAKPEVMQAGVPGSPQHAASYDIPARQPLKDRLRRGSHRESRP
jgi:hypothetical protein